MVSRHPHQPRPAGTTLDRNDSKLFQPFKIRGCEFQNRIWVSPMCQYSATDDGHMTDFHFAHLSALALRGPSLTIVEATSVVPEGRITPWDCGLWQRSQIEPLARITKMAHQYKQKIGIQLAHAGRKASTKPPWQLARGLRSEIAVEGDGGWPDAVVGPSPETWGQGHCTPHSMTSQDISKVVAAFAQSAAYAVEAGVDAIEVHGAHGYLLSSFLSATSNHRKDKYGGSLANRMRLSLEIVEAVRRVIPDTMPLSFRVSGSEWLPSTITSAWDIDSSVTLATELHRRGVDLLTISSGGNAEAQTIPRELKYQTDLAQAVRQRLRQQGCNILIGAVGRIADPAKANALLTSEEPSGDVVLIGRQFLKEPSWVLRAANELRVRVQWPIQYQLGRYGLEAKL